MMGTWALWAGSLPLDYGLATEPFAEDGPREHQRLQAAVRQVLRAPWRFLSSALAVFYRALLYRIWVVVKIMVPFRVLSRIRHLVFRHHMCICVFWLVDSIWYMNTRILTNVVLVSPFLVVGALT